MRALVHDCASDHLAHSSASPGPIIAIAGHNRSSTLVPDQRHHCVCLHNGRLCASSMKEGRVVSREARVLVYLSAGGASLALLVCAACLLALAVGVDRSRRALDEDIASVAAAPPD